MSRTAPWQARMAIRMSQRASGSSMTGGTPNVIEGIPAKAGRTLMILGMGVVVVFMDRRNRRIFPICQADKSYWIFPIFFAKLP
jgi:hypothetical protein